LRHGSLLSNREISKESKTTKENKDQYWNSERVGVRKCYEATLNKEIEIADMKDIDTDWETIKDAVKKAAKQCVGVLKKGKNSWYN